MSMAAALQNLESVAHRTGSVAESVAKTINLGRPDWEAIGEAAVRVLRPRIIKMLVKNYHASGMKVQTGKLLGAITNANVYFVWKRTRPSIQIAMQSGIAPYKSKGKKSDFYEVAGSQNYGAVILPDSKAGAKAKRTIKNKLLAGKKNVASRGYVYNAQGGRSAAYNLSASGGGEKSIRATSAGGGSSATVIKPKDFFQLNSQQQKLIEKEIYKRMLDMALQRIGS